MSCISSFGKDYKPGNPLPQSSPKVTERKIRRLWLLADDTNPKVREAAAGSSYAPQGLLQHLAKDVEASVRAIVARNPNTDKYTRFNLEADPSDYVRTATAIYWWTQG